MTKLQKIPFIQGESPDNRYPINLFFLPKSFNGRDSMIGTPGLTARVTSLDSFPVRNMKTDKNKEYLYAVVGKKVYLIDKFWNAYAASTTLSTSSGYVWMEPNLSQMMIVDGEKGYIVTRSGTSITVTKITDDDFVIPSSLTMQDNYFIVSQKNSFNFQISSLSDGTSWNAADLGTAEGNPDNILSILSDHRQLFLFGSKSGEIFYNSGDSTFPFQRYPDVFIENGIGAKASLIKADNSVFYLDDNFLIKRLDGFTPKIVSPRYLNVLITKLSTKSDAICYSYIRQGNTFFVIVFPTEDVTYVLNLATGFVHQWASGVSQKRHRSNCYEYFNDKDLVGDYSNGIIYSLEDDVYTDNGDTIKWTYTSPIYEVNGRTLFHKELNLKFNSGVGLQSGQGNDPEVILRYSDTDCKTWSNEIIRKLGKVGKYKHIVKWTRLGGSRNRCYEISGSDPVKRQFSEARLNYEVGRG